MLIDPPSALTRTALGLVLSLALAAAAPADQQNRLSKEELADGWILLFDGETLFGWQAASQADWRVADGAIVVSQGDPGLLCTNSQFGDFVLKADFRSAKGTNSGIFLRTGMKPDNPRDGCYELNIADFGTTPFATGSLVAREKVEENLDSEDWQTFEVTAKGPRITVAVDGRQVLDHVDNRQPVLRGHIGLQLNMGKVEFRNLKLKPLSLKSVFNGKDLAGWHVHPDRQQAFAVTDKGELAVKGGPGQLESDTQYGDFVLRLEGISNLERSNSGLFFRSIPGEFTNGYECQIQHAYAQDGKPHLVDCGTGGICRRQIARKLVAKDHEWFHLTLVVCGPQMAAWVNGYPVSDWTDDRAPHANPRNGKRLEPGTLIFQAHDPQTDFLFRNLHAAELPRRE